ncbi:hypothetical protein [Endozoicomonas sp. SESOKO1]|uniref:hypothetical protein n=1 Tax=Endozoicomonas sp. SESOKO1 TaxID=2828742 RepID=UPI002148DF6E|nr:hypothetical protein [Endozoicomonas sp. SESOKO1]
MILNAQHIKQAGLDPNKFQKVLEEGEDYASSLPPKVKIACFNGLRSVKDKELLKNYVNLLSEAINKGTKIDENQKIQLAQRALEKAEAVCNKTKPTKTVPAEKNEPIVVATKPSKAVKLDPSRLKPFEN